MCTCVDTRRHWGSLRPPSAVGSRAGRIVAPSPRQEQPFGLPGVLGVCRHRLGAGGQAGVQAGAGARGCAHAGSKEQSSSSAGTER